jgi:hypothetical protein
MVILGIVGSRYYNDYDNFKVIMDQWKQNNIIITEIVSGGADGVDSLAEKYATEYNIPCKVFKANWSKYGRSAGPIRNTEIVKICTHILALPGPDSIGTYDTISKAKKANLIITEIKVDK